MLYERSINTVQGVQGNSCAGKKLVIMYKVVAVLQLLRTAAGSHIKNRRWRKKKREYMRTNKLAGRF